MWYKLYVDGYEGVIREFQSEEEASRFVARYLITNEITIEETGVGVKTTTFHLVRPDSTKITYVPSDEHLNQASEEDIKLVSIDYLREELTPPIRKHLLTHGYPHER